MSVPDLLRDKSPAIKRTIGLVYLVVAAVIAAICWGVMSAGFDGSFGLPDDEVLQTSRWEARGAVYLLALPGILIVLFLVLGLRMVITGKVGGEKE